MVRAGLAKLLKLEKEFATIDAAKHPKMLIVCEDTTVTGLFNNGSTQVLLRLQSVVNAKAYQVQTSADNGKTWPDAVISPKANRIVILSLVPGTTYLVRARAIGGSTGASNWTSPGSIMCT